MLRENGKRNDVGMRRSEFTGYLFRVQLGSLYVDSLAVWKNQMDETDKSVTHRVRTVLV